MNMTIPLLVKGPDFTYVPLITSHYLDITSNYEYSFVAHSLVEVIIEFDVFNKRIPLADTDYT